MQELNSFSNYLIDPGFQEVNRLSVLLFGNNNNNRTTSYKQYFLSALETNKLK